MADEFCLKMPDFHVTFRDLLHAVNLRHETNGFTSLLKEGVLRIFSPWKIRRLRPGLNPRTWVPKASTLRLEHRSRFNKNSNKIFLRNPDLHFLKPSEFQGTSFGTYPNRNKSWRQCCTYVQNETGVHLFITYQIKSADDPQGTDYGPTRYDVM